MNSFFGAQKRLLMKEKKRTISAAGYFVLRKRRTIKPSLLEQKNESELSQRKMEDGISPSTSNKYESRKRCFLKNQINCSIHGKFSDEE